VIRYIAGLIVGATGALIGVYCVAALLPATREERPRDPLPQRTFGGPVHEYRTPDLSYTA
jgi:hypothetical protein